MCEKEKTQLVAEVNILRELRNPFIVRYHDRIVDKVYTLILQPLIINVLLASKNNYSIIFFFWKHRILKCYNIL